ncbi:hypothetical protein CC86DRAFT_398698 [Ophiobolus disseminans]|uniref:Calcineurin-like phosphoesterase domain-containing protein n=1 Tax=Ophiobolus disseminans TaxID=1469910 RepID=A0A6A6ZEM0_9PLEO|nr:hypothetical protein CC86DRAFT_398698 [Ophiobolus disseminans]
MTLQIISDLYLESPKGYDVFKIVPKAPHLALLGDIGNAIPHKSDLVAFLTHQLTQFRAMLFVPGNHEAYYPDWATTLEFLRTFGSQVQNDGALGDFILSDRTVLRLPDTDITILGCSLFSSIPPKSEMAVSMGLNDFFQTDGWVAALEGTDSKVAISTHWSPSVDARSSDPEHGASPIFSGFSTDHSPRILYHVLFVGKLVG